MLLIRRIHFLYLIVYLTALACMIPTARAQFASPGQLPRINAKTQAMIVDSVTAAIDSVYVIGEAADRIVAGLRSNLEAGDYDELTDPVEFAQRLQTDAQAINHDGHFRLRALPPLDPEFASQKEDPRETERQDRRRRDRNYGFKTVEILAGGVGYLRFDSFGRGDEAFEAAAAAMNFMANSNAVIIDLRQNQGGSAAMIRFISGYLFEENTHLISWYERVTDRTIQSYSPDYVPGRRLIEQTVYVLTSDRTFSAAEEFTFDLQNHERAIVVGDTTGGGGHTVAAYFFDFEEFRINMRLPDSRAFNPENNEGWEGVGIIPDISVPVDQALDTAHEDALKKLIADEQDEEYRARLEWTLLDIQARLNPFELAFARMEEYIGAFGPRRIFVSEGALHYQREERPPFRLEPIGEDLFSVGDLDYFRLGFKRDDNGQIVKIIGLYDDGTQDEHERNDDLSRQ